MTARTAIPATGTESLQKQIDNLSFQLTQGFERLESLLRSFDERVRMVETTQAGCQPLLTSRLDAAWRKLDEHEVSIDALSKAIGEMKDLIKDLTQTNRVLRWILYIFTAMLLLIAGEIIRGNLRLIKP